VTTLATRRSTFEADPVGDTYRTIARGASADLKDRGSRFIAEAFPVVTEEAAEAEIEAIRKREYNATHHCTAFRIGADGDLFRFNDDGEPAGTGGPPILRQIDGRGLTNTLVVVTRYYGGTKLGTGGLIRAYGDAAAAALDACPILERVTRVTVRIRFSYGDTSPAMHTIGRFDARIRATEYAADTSITLGLRRSQVEAFVRAFTDALGGRGEVVVDG
jgi:uncharacterized YigZ family protein